MPECFDRLLPALTARQALTQSPSEGLARLAWALGKSGHRPPPAFLDALFGQLQLRHETHGVGLSLAQLADVLWAAASLGVRPDQKLVNAFVGANSDRLSGLIGCQLVATVNAGYVCFTVCGTSPPPPPQPPCRQACSSR